MKKLAFVAFMLLLLVVACKENKDTKTVEEIPVSEETSEWVYLFDGKTTDGWRAYLNPAKALRLGFHQDRSFEDNIRWFLEDDIRR